MRISVSADELTGVASVLVAELERRGNEVVCHGVLVEDERNDWAWASEAVARDVAEGRVEQGIVCCWTGTGASIAANKVDGVRAALCGDAVTAAGARRWNNANVLALSLRTTSQALLSEILDAWFGGNVSDEPDDRANITHVGEIDKARARLGQIAEEIADDDEPVVLTRRGEAVAVLVSPAEYDRMVESKRRMAQEQLQARLAVVRQNVAAAGLDVSVVDEAITAARAAE